MLGNHLKNKKMKEKQIQGTSVPGQRVMLSVPFVLMAIVFNVCLIASNLFETKVFSAGPLALTGGVLIFPVSYIINDCIVEVWGYRKARLVIWTGFAMNFFVVAMAQIVRLLPAAGFWDGGEHFDYIFALAPRVTVASLLAFLSGSTVNAWILGHRLGEHAAPHAAADIPQDCLRSGHPARHKPCREGREEIRGN